MITLLVHRQHSTASGLILHTGKSFDALLQSSKGHDIGLQSHNCTRKATVCTVKCHAGLPFTVHLAWHRLTSAFFFSSCLPFSSRHIVSASFSHCLAIPSPLGTPPELAQPTIYQCNHKARSVMETHGNWYWVVSVKICLFVMRLNVPVNNFSVMSGRSQRFLGLTCTVRS